MAQFSSRPRREEWSGQLPGQGGRPCLQGLCAKLPAGLGWDVIKHAGPVGTPWLSLADERA